LGALVMWDVEAKPLNPQDAIDWFRSRLPLTDPQFRALSNEARRRAFFVSGLATLDMVQETMDALDSALAKGETFETFKGRLTERITKAWGGGSPHRLRTIFDTNIQSAYGAGRYRAAADLAAERPFWRFEAVMDGRTSRICSTLAGLTMPANDPRWQGRIPPLHFRCRSALVTLSAAQAKGQRIFEGEPALQGMDGFGQIPGEREYTPSQADYHPELWKTYQSQRTPLVAEDEKPTEGVQFRSLESKLKKKDQDEVLRGINTAGLIEWMKANPLTELNLGTYSKRNSNGQFTIWPATGKTRVDVRSTRKPETYGSTLEPGKTWSISACGPDKLDAMKRTLVHELGHHLWYADPNKVAPIARAAFAKGKPITEYAKSNAKEYFSETFAAYAFHRGTLRQFDPEGYDMIEEVKKVLGIP
jgi:SPP1 gp7 family putative phage head morphogenesis protein